MKRAVVRFVPEGSTCWNYYRQRWGSPSGLGAENIARSHAGASPGAIEHDEWIFRRGLMLRPKGLSVTVDA